MRKGGRMSLRPTKPYRSAALAGALGVGLVLSVSACGSGDEKDAGGGSSTPAADCAKYSEFGDIKGKTVSVYTSIVTPEDKPQIDSYKPFEDCTGVTIKYEGDKAFETQVLVRAKAGNP